MRKRIVFILLVLLLVATNSMSFASNNVVYTQTLEQLEKSQEYIVKWRYAPIADADEYVVLEHDHTIRVSLIKVLSTDARRVIEQLQQSSNVEYIELNTRLEIQVNTTTFDTKDQYYLDQTRLRDARNLVEINTDLTIAVLDTGVDLSHPDLIGNLVTGVNLIDSKKTPQDDHGHGTMVAGIIAATGKYGYEGILPKINIMPVKVMHANGSGDSLTVSKGVRYAVDNGADIIALSLADFNYSKKLAEEMAYAESKNVLVVAATGNGGNPVQYPAAYPTVLAVGAVDQQDRVAAYSNFGQQVDVVAPGTSIYSLKLGGGYRSSTGTSMAGPQVVGLAALILSKYPDYTPAQVRNLLRYATSDIGTMNWNEKTGYGRIDAIAALLAPLPADIYEPNNSAAEAKVAPLGKQVNAALNATNDIDWFTITVPYDGNLRIDWQRDTSSPTTSLRMTLYDAQMVEISTFSSRLDAYLAANVKKGTYRVKIEVLGPLVNTGLQYSFTSSFRIYDDAYGNNHSSATAFAVPITQGELSGTLSKDYEEDWFAFHIPIEGEFSYMLYTDTPSIDTVVTVIKPNNQRTVTDKSGFQNGNVEQDTFQVSEGTLLIGIRNYYEQATNGIYTLQWNYRPEMVDNNEPNNSLFAATTLKLKQPVYGYIASIADYDYFKFTVEEEGIYQVAGSNFPAKVRPSMSLYNAKYERIAIVSLKDNETQFSHQSWLTKGTYFIRIDARTKFTNQLYSLMVEKVDTLFRDLSNHWAQDSINHLASIGVIKGYEDKTFRPNNAITRAEFVHLLVKSLGITSATNVNVLPFTDVTDTYWARDSIRIAYFSGLVTGYENNTFRPEGVISRSEMVAMLARGLDLKPVGNSSSIRPNGQLAVQKFTDINQTNWYTDALSVLQQLDMINGFNDGTFRPNANTSRAEAATMLARIWFR